MFRGNEGHMFGLKLRSSRLMLVPVVLTGALFVAACTSDDDATETPAAPTATTAPTEAPTTAPAGTPDATEVPSDELVSGEIAVDGFDYGFNNLPSRIAVGSTITLTNSSATELHELVAIALPEGEERTIDELITLPEAELGALLSAEPAMVLVTPPGGEQITFVGTGEVTAPGRYIVLCAIPAGANAEAWLEAAAESPGGPPEVEGGPPHFIFGMYGEFTAEAAE